MSSCEKPYTNQDKWIVSIISGLLFLLIASPFLFSTINAITENFGFSIAEKNGCPNMGGLILHSLVFVVIVRLMMR